MLKLALCKCGVDLSEHIGRTHVFSAAGTKYTCDIAGCDRPRYHEEQGISCGPLTGDLLW